MNWSILVGFEIFKDFMLNLFKETAPKHFNGWF